MRIMCDRCAWWFDKTESEPGPLCASCEEVDLMLAEMAAVEEAAMLEHLEEQRADQ